MQKFPLKELSGSLKAYDVTSLIMNNPLSYCNVCSWSKGNYKQGIMEIFAHEEENLTDNFNKQYALLKIDLTSLDVDVTNESLEYGPGMIFMRHDRSFSIFDSCLLSGW